jgi:hypothetical protein
MVIENGNLLTSSGENIGKMAGGGHCRDERQEIDG